MSEEQRTAALVAAAQNGNREAIAELLHLYGKMAYAVIGHMLFPRPDVDDVYQEACVQALTSIRSLREPERFGGWFKQIAIRKAVDCLRRTEHARLQADVPADSGLEKEVVEQDEHHSVRRAVLKLAPHYRDVVILYYWSECSYREISEALSIPQGTVMSRLNKAKRLLADELAPKREEGSSWT